MAERLWYCVIKSETYALLYIGQDPEEAARATTPDSCCAEGRTMGEAQRNAAMGAGKLTQSKRPEPKAGQSYWRFGNP